MPDAAKKVLKGLKKRQKNLPKKFIFKVKEGEKLK